MVVSCVFEDGRVEVKVLIRPALPSDSVGILHAHEDSIRSIASRDHTESEINGWCQNLSAASYTRAMASGEKMFVAERDGEIVGFSAVRENTICAVYVAGKFSNKGVGKELYFHAENFARTRGVKSLALTSSLTAKDFYVKMGFVIGKDVVHTFASGVQVICTEMRKVLI